MRLLEDTYADGLLAMYDIIQLQTSKRGVKPEGFFQYESVTFFPEVGCDLKQTVLNQGFFFFFKI